MGYTRYYYLTGKNFKNEDGDMFLNIVKNIIENAKKMYDIDIFDGWGENEPVINKEYISLNGDAIRNLDHESFIIKPSRFYEDSFEFCKTAEKPYDIVVNAVLKAAKALQFVKNVSSDGDNEEEKAEDLFLKSVPDNFVEYTKNLSKFVSK